LSRADFNACDIVEEIRKLVDASGMSRDKLNIEVTESVIGSDFEFMKSQIERFRSLGFRVWMDDFGSGYSTLDVLQSIRFDLIKFDMRFMKEFDTSEKSRIMLTELIRMAISLGVDTVCEGVETKEQADFLREIGCTMMQGYYFCRPIPFEKILERYQKVIQIGFENPEESGYYAAVGKINLYDLAILSNEDQE
ncbi:MAG: EAL domain-containing protein, partial [Ruminococcus sp.]|nr:EAL domain-containing protein [Ruminococcus sp.]